MKKYNDFIKEYLFTTPSNVVYGLKEGGRFSNDEDWVEIIDEKYRKYNLMSMSLHWELDGKYEARKNLPRSKYRRLYKRVARRLKKLSKKYR